MLSLDTNKNSNLLKLIVYSGNYDLSLNANLVQKFINKMVLKNWKVTNNTIKIYILRINFFCKFI